ncbi:MAG: undecaprenyl-phosphate glucose phosphotransferase [bacterium]|nr:undecaprenyl-phosphate glucose phosphotransferase [bacterium]
MSKTAKTLILLLTDFISIQIAFILWCRVRSSMGFFAAYDFKTGAPTGLIIYSFWLLLFLFFGLYQAWHTRSRTDEFIDILKVVSVGVFLIFLVTFDLERDLERPFSISRVTVLLYWLLMVALTGSGRALLRTALRKMLEHGYGRQRTVIVGWGRKAWELFNQTEAAPALGYSIVGFVHPGEKTPKGAYRGVPLLGPLDRLHEVVRRRNIHEVLVAIPRRSERVLEQVISECNGLPVGMKIVPDLYDVIVGRVRTNQIYGFPLIEILPHLISPWERRVKRLLDFGFSLLALTAALPVCLLVAIAIKIDSKGPVIYSQERVGRNGRHFRVYKFRSMVRDAEKHSGPVWAKKNDPRVTAVGRVLRKLRLDEIPQLWNVLKGDMSIVGPRPERPYFVEKLKKIYPLYSRRLLVRPGLTGWAQVKGRYDETIEDVKNKLEYDLYYLENMSLRMDLKIVLSTVAIVLGGKGH